VRVDAAQVADNVQKIVMRSLRRSPWRDAGDRIPFTSQLATFRCRLLPDPARRADPAKPVHLEAAALA
jgi:hypothetical protein